MLNYKPEINYEDLPALEEAFTAGQITHDNIYYVISTETRYRLDHSGRGLVEMSDPAADENAKICIWWLDAHHVVAAHYQSEQSDTGQMNIPPLPGHLRMAFNSIVRGTAFDGHLIVPMTLRNIVDPDHVDDVIDSQSLKSVLYSKFVGIPFEIAHYDKIKHYAGLITTMDLAMPDLCAMREMMDGGR
ncbi:hypothetical protein D9M68_19350 [compost metagenome]